MKIAGIICEYNPFHSGHAFQIAETRRQMGCDYIAVCMAGSFVQRGEPACLSKQTRAEMALRCGADAVFELPALYTLRSAEIFAQSGVSILAGIGVDVLSFGSEIADLHLLNQIAELRENEPETVSFAIQKALDEGKSYALAQGEAFSEHLNIPKGILENPNLILEAEYIRAIHRLKAKICPIAIQRTNDYHAKETGEGFASATAIRQLLTQGKIEEAGQYIPEDARFLLCDWKGMHTPDDLLLYRLRTMQASELSKLPDVSEGLENRVKRAAAEAFDAESLMKKIKCKRYTRARLNRLCVHALLNLTRDLADRHPIPAYARLIGVRNSARPLLKELKARASIPIISDPKQIENSEVFQLECSATDLRALYTNDPAQRRQGTERTAKFVSV